MVVTGCIDGVKACMEVAVGYLDSVLHEVEVENTVNVVSMDSDKARLDVVCMPTRDYTYVDGDMACT